MGTPSPLPLPLFQEAEDWFKRARASLLGALPCGRGCCECCTGIFPITRLDALEIRRGFTEVPETIKHAIIARAQAQIATIEAAYPMLTSNPSLDEWADHTIDDMVEQFAHLPCPALGTDGSCSLYAYRPITCRTMGIPSETNGMVHGACTVQTAIPIIRLSPSLRTDLHQLAEDEAIALSTLHSAQLESDDELLLPYGFV